MRSGTEGSHEANMSGKDLAALPRRGVDAHATLLCKVTHVEHVCDGNLLCAADGSRQESWPLRGLYCHSSKALIA